MDTALYILCKQQRRSVYRNISRELKIRKGSCVAAAVIAVIKGIVPDFYVLAYIPLNNMMCSHARGAVLKGAVCYRNVCHRSAVVEVKVYMQSLRRPVRGSIGLLTVLLGGARKQLKVLEAAAVYIKAAYSVEQHRMSAAEAREIDIFKLQSRYVTQGHYSPCHLCIADVSVYNAADKAYLMLKCACKHIRIRSIFRTHYLGTFLKFKDSI